MELKTKFPTVCGRSRKLAPLVTAVLTAAAIGCGQPPEQQGLVLEEGGIVGGTVAGTGAWPWQALLSTPGFPVWCGGDLLSPSWVLTAGHCVFGVPVNNFTVTLGEQDRSTRDGFEQSFAVDMAIMNPNYICCVGPYDVALLHLVTPLAFNQRVQSIRPAVDGDSPGLNATVTGWGSSTGQQGTSTTQLMQATIPIVDNSNCTTVALGPLGPTQMCAGINKTSKGSCFGDSGGPLVVQRPTGSWELVGSVSFGSGDCSGYGVYARMSNLVGWIRQYVVDVAVLSAISPLT